jgi:hypothetical protein
MPMFPSVPFAIVATHLEQKLARRGQNVEFVTGQGSLSTACNQSYYTLQSGSLYQVTNTMALQFSANQAQVGAGYAPFVPQDPTTNGEYTGTFQTTTNGVLLWLNSAFPNGGTQFCIDQTTQQVLVVFEDLYDFRLSYANGCSPVQLTVVDGTS